ncbi:MAG: sugar-binding protein [Victivallaceae bacterium]
MKRNESCLQGKPFKNYKLLLMMKKIIFVALIVFYSGFIFADKQITVFHSLGKINLTQFSMEVNVFSDEKVLTDNKESTLRICESIDNSKLIIFSPSTPSEVFKKLFDTPEINKSIRELMHRDGIIFFGPTTWKIITSLPESLMTFYRDYDVPAVTGDMYRGLKTKEGQIIYMQASPNKESKDDLLSKPNNFINPKDNKNKLLAIIYFASLPKNKFDILFYYQTPQYPLMIASKKTDKGGLMIFSYCYNVYQETDHPFIENLIWKAYGPQEKVSAKQQVRKKLNQSTAPEIINENIILLDKEASPENQFLDAKTVKLHNWIKKSAPQKATTVKVSSNSKMLYVSFLCDEPDMKNIVAKCTRQDSNVWDDDSVELFISSLDKTSDRYHYIINSNSLYYDSKNQNSNWNGKFEVKVKRNTKSWQVDLAIPFSDFNFSDNEYFRMNFCRNEKQLNELTSWSESLHFMNPQTWGYVSKKSKESLAQKLSIGTANNSKGEIIIKNVPLWTKHYPDSSPKDSSSKLNTEIIVAGNEKESTAFEFSNTYDQNVYFRIEPETYLSGTKIPFQKVFTLKSAIPWMAKSGEVFAEPLVKLDEANILVVPGLESRILWIDTKTNIPPGDYIWNFGVVSTNTKIPYVKISVKLKVLNLTFPEQLPVQVYTFGPYRSSYEGLIMNKLWQTCADYHINWVQGSKVPIDAIKRDSQGKLIVSTNSADYKDNEFEIQKLGLKCVFGYGIYDDFIKRLKSLGEKRTIESPEIQEIFRQWFLEWVKYLKKNNFDFKNAIFPLLDEPHTSVIKQLVIAGKIMHEVDSAVKITTTTATWSTMADLKELNEVLDVWLPWEPRITTRQGAKEELSFLQSTSKNILPYLCSRNGNTSSYLNYFRYRGIRSYLAKCDGFSLWACNSWRTNSNEWMGSRKNTEGSWLFQHSDQGFIPTIRAEAFREGAEDMYLLLLGEKLAKEKSNSRLEKLVSPAYLNALLAKGDSESTKNWRDELIVLIAALKNNNN